MESVIGIYILVIFIFNINIGIVLNSLLFTIRPNRNICIHESVPINNVIT